MLEKNPKNTHNCMLCGESFYRSGTKKPKYCSLKCKRISQKNIIPWNKGKKLPHLSGENNKKYSRVDKTCTYCGIIYKARKYLVKTTKYCSRSCGMKAKIDSINSKPNMIKRPNVSGKNHYLWIEDRTKLKTGRVHAYDYKYREWSKSVKNRDSWKCKISNGNCSGRLESHHILRWKDYPELRYEVNNGITLCHFHHPRKIKDELELAPLFYQLVVTIEK